MDFYDEQRRHVTDGGDNDYSVLTDFRGFQSLTPRPPLLGGCKQEV